MNNSPMKKKFIKKLKFFASKQIRRRFYVKIIYYLIKFKYIKGLNLNI